MHFVPHKIDWKDKISGANECKELFGFVFVE